MSARGKRLAFAGAKYTTLETMQDVLRSGFDIDLLVTLSPEQADRFQVAGYLDLRGFAADEGISTIVPETYSLAADADEVALLAQGIDCLIVVGWQRLIPDWWLSRLSCGAFGMHGSAEGLPRGRGRSPMNWALKQGKQSFRTHLFRYDAGVDSGAVVGEQRFDINIWDDCHSLHLKNRLSMSRLLARDLGHILAGTVTAVPQRTDVEPTYLPKRSAEDGRIDWIETNMMELYNHVRCQTHPFPGAFSHLEGAPDGSYFWRIVPFDTHLEYPTALPGTVVEVFHDETFLVALWDGSVRVVDYEGTTPSLGQRFTQFPEGHLQ